MLVIYLLYLRRADGERGEQRSSQIFEPVCCKCPADRVLCLVEDNVAIVPRFDVEGEEYGGTIQVLKGNSNSIVLAVCERRKRARDSVTGDRWEALALLEVHMADVRHRRAGFGEETGDSARLR